VVARKASSIVCVLALSGALAACGSSSSSSSGVTPASYVKSICQAIGPFAKDVGSRASALNFSTTKSPAEIKKALQGFLSAAAADSDGAVNKLKAADVPNVTNGKTISDTIVKTFTQLKTAFSQLASQAAALPTGSPAAFKTAAEALGTSVRTSMSGIGSSLSGLKSAELEKAAKSEPACTSLGA
jgi:hypothetical protein